MAFTHFEYDPDSSLPPERRFRLVVTATDVTRGELVYFPWDYERTYGRPPRWPTFGVKLLPLLPMDAAKLLPIAGLFKHGPVALAANLAMTTIVGRDQAHLAKPWVKIRTMQVDTAGVNPVDFRLSRTQSDSGDGTVRERPSRSYTVPDGVGLGALPGHLP